MTQPRRFVPRSSTPLLGLAALLVVSVAAGCGRERLVSRIDSQFHTYYATSSGPISLPSADLVHESGRSAEIGGSMTKVWDSCMAVLTQYPAVLAIDRTGVHRQAMVLAPIPQTENPEHRERRAIFGEFREGWLVLAVSPGATAETKRVSVASFTPSGRLLKGAGASHRLLGAIKATATASHGWRQLIDSPLTDKGSTRCLNKLCTTWLFKSDARLEHRLGSWVSKRMRLSLIEVYCPEATAKLESIVARLLKYSSHPHLKTRVRIVASTNVMAFALPNGDIYVSSGMLDAMQTPDEVAAVLSHELIHLMHHDTIGKLKTAAFGRASANWLRLAGSLAGSAIGAFAAAAGPAGELIGNMSGQLVHQSSQMGAQYLEGGLATDYAADIELRADAKGYRLLVASGCDPEAQFAMFDRLEAIDKYVKKNDLALVSNLINMKPGLQERRDRLLKLRRGLQSARNR